MSFLNTSLKNTIKTSLKTTLTSKVQSYTIAYTSGLETYTNDYNITYDSHYLTSFSTKYTLGFTSVYGDSVNQYRIRYTSGVELTERTSRYSLKYSSNYTMIYTNNYTLRYTTLSPTENSYRHIYKVKYTSTGSRQVSMQYTIRYGLEFFKDRSLSYSIRYTSVTPYALNTSAVLVQTSNTTGALFCIRGDKSMLENSLFVFSNLPRYQLVALDYEEERPNFVWLDVEGTKPYNLFLESITENSQEVVAYLLVRDVNELNNMSLDIYDKESLEKKNRSKSYFFNLDNNYFIVNPVNLGGILYTYTNSYSDFYSYDYLNFVERSLTPLFRLGDDCCFNAKINTKASNDGGRCSPF